MQPKTAPFESLESTSVSSAERRGVDRRRRPTPILSRYTLTGGRRQDARRDVESRSLYVDRYDPWLAAVLIVIGALCALDAVFTLLYIQKGGTEANPIMAELIEFGPQTFVIVKCVVTNLGLAVLCLHKNFRLVKPAVWTLVTLYSALLVYHLWLAAAVA